jgi:UDP-N-acetylmuramoyl-L-alanyl-D-glutamate--2,6-diaminopimelate ligase
VAPCRKILRDLLGGVAVLSSRGSLDVPVRRVRADSRAVQAGDVFVCLPGYRTEGGESRADRHDFIPEAVRRGAAALVLGRDVEVPPGPTVVRVADAWTALAGIAAAYHDHPSRQLLTVGVTGTSGKTSTTYLVESVLAHAGHRTGRIGTIEYKLGDAVRPADQTTPEAHDLQELLREAVDRAVSALVMEVSSHALELSRVAAIDYDVAVFTNLSQDHLNFHADMRDYRRAKGRLFEALGVAGKRGIGAINLDDPEAQYFLAINRGQRLTYGTGASADVRAEDVRLGASGARFLARTPAGPLDIAIGHLGDYSVHNALAAIAVGIALDLPLEAIREGVGATPQVPGRFEPVDCGQDFLAVVDYAHKPGALERVLLSARALQPHRLITVFGCGGDRDRAKRSVMGTIAARLSDLVVVTSDNPRSEEPAAIIDDIVRGIPAGTRLVVEPDRAAAIALALARAEAGDLVLIAGKGHENYQLLGGRRIPFDDREVVRRVLTRADRAEL